MLHGVRLIARDGPDSGSGALDGDGVSDELEHFKVVVVVAVS